MNKVCHVLVGINWLLELVIPWVGQAESDQTVPNTFFLLIVQDFHSASPTDICNVAYCPQFLFALKGGSPHIPGLGKVDAIIPETRKITNEMIF